LEIPTQLRACSQEIPTKRAAGAYTLLTQRIGALWQSAKSMGSVEVNLDSERIYALPYGTVEDGLDDVRRQQGQEEDAGQIRQAGLLALYQLFS
jgi:hypothetical protein